MLVSSGMVGDVFETFVSGQATPIIEGARTPEPQDSRSPQDLHEINLAP